MFERRHASAKAAAPFPAYRDINRAPCPAAFSQPHASRAAVRHPSGGSTSFLVRAKFFRQKKAWRLPTLPPGATRQLKLPRFYTHTGGVIGRHALPHLFIYAAPRGAAGWHPSGGSTIGARGLDFRVRRRHAPAKAAAPFPAYRGRYRAPCLPAFSQPHAARAAVWQGTGGLK